MIFESLHSREKVNVKKIYETINKKEHKLLCELQLKAMAQK